jgi:glycosyltransferase involved in cell wall biosynthesis
MRPEGLNRSVKVSIGMPVFNGERFIEEAIDSILQQSHTDFELIISDNASTDRTGEICREYAAKDERVVYICNRVNYGLVLNFNNVFRLSRGEYFRWAAADDICDKDFLIRCVQILDDDASTVLAFPRTVGIDAEGSRVELPHMVVDANSPRSTYSVNPVIRFRQIMRNPWWVSGPFFGLIRSAVLEHTSLHGNFHGGDHVLISELALRGRFHEIQEELFFLRMHAGKGSAIRSLPDRIAFMDVDPGDKHGVRLWRLVRGHPRRLMGYLSTVSHSPLDRGQKAQCYLEVARAVGWWVTVRGTRSWARARPNERLGRLGRALSCDRRSR